MGTHTPRPRAHTAASSPARLPRAVKHNHHHARDEHRGVVELGPVRVGHFVDGPARRQLQPRLHGVVALAQRDAVDVRRVLGPTGVIKQRLAQPKRGSEALAE